MTDTFATELTQKIAAMGLNSKREIENVPVSPGLISITGHFVKDDEGNRFRQTVIGLGIGQSSLDTKVRLLAPCP